jgi:hypothetical protein
VAGVALVPPRRVVRVVVGVVDAVVGLVTVVVDAWELDDVSAMPPAMPTNAMPVTASATVRERSAG